jgi:hypothetical protein
VNHSKVESGGVALDRILPVSLVVLILVICPSFPESIGHESLDPPKIDDTIHPPDPEVGADGIRSMVGDRFIENRGQMVNGDIRFYSVLDNGMVSFFDDGMVYSIHGDTEGPFKGVNVRYTFEGSNDVSPRGERRGTGEYNYLQSTDPSRWTTHVPCYSEIRYPDIYHGIDLVYTFMSGQLKYNFLISPGADPDDISIGIDGHTDLFVNVDGSLLIMISIGSISDSGLTTYYSDNPGEVIPSSFDIIDGSSFGFSIGEYDESRGFIIDPVVRGTLVGGTEKEMGVGIAVDDTGAVYVTGSSGSTDLPTTPGAFNGSFPGTYRAVYAVKLNPELSELEYCTYIGSHGTGYSIDVDGNGCAYITGRSYNGTFPTTPNAFQRDWRGSYDAIIFKLSPDGSDLVYSSFLGGEDADWGIDIKVGPDGAAYITGDTGSFNFSVTDGAYQTEYGGGRVDGYVAKVSPDGSELVYCTLFGGSDYDRGIGIDVDSDGYAYVAGYSNSSDLGATPGAYNLSRSGNRDVFVLKLDKDGSKPIFMTYIGPGTVSDIGVDRWGNITVGGDSFQGFPTTPGSYSFAQDGAYLAKLNKHGNKLLYSAIIGAGPSLGVAVEPNGTMYLTGETSRSDFPTTPNAFQPELAGGRDLFLVIIQPSGIAYSTYLGTKQSEGVRDLAVDKEGYAFLTGYTYYSDFYSSSNAYCSTIQGSYDIFVLKYMTDIKPPVADAGHDVTIGQHELVMLDGKNSSDDRGIINWTTLKVSDATGAWSTDEVVVVVMDTTDPIARAGEDRTIDQFQEVELNGTDSSDNVGITSVRWYFTYRGETETYAGLAVRFTIDDAGVYNVTLNVTDAQGNSAEDHLNVTVRDTTGPLADAGEDIIVGPGQEVQFNGSGSSDNVLVTNWTWSFTHDGDPVKLHGSKPTFTFEGLGEYTVRLVVVDEVGLSSSDDVTVDVVEDPPLPNEPPVISDLNIPLTGHVIEEGAPLTLSGKVTDDYGLEWVRYSLDGETFTDVALLDGDRWRVAEEDLPLGWHVVNVTARDIGGLESSVEVSLVVNVPGEPPEPPAQEDDWTWRYVVIFIVVVAVVTIVIVVYKRASG